jgi:Family of unknown function (DUF6152)
MRVARLLNIGVCTLVVFPMLVSLASAHHSTAGMDNKTELSLRGVVVQYVWRNPHVVVQWDVKDETGKVVRWTGQLSSPTTMMQAGMNRESLKIGDEVVIGVNPSKTGEPQCVIRTIKDAAGKVILSRLTPE